MLRALLILLQLVSRIRDDPDAKRSVEILLDLAAKYVEKVEEAAEAGQTLAQEARIDVDVDDKGNHVDQATSALRSFIEALTGRPLTPILEVLQKTASDVRENPELKGYFGDLDAFVRKLLAEPQWASSRAATRRAEELYDRGSNLRLSNPAWKQDARGLFSELELLYDGVKHDSTLLEVGRAATALLADFATLTQR